MKKLTDEEIEYFYDLLIEYEKEFLKTLNHKRQSRFNYHFTVDSPRNIYESSRESEYEDCHYLHAYDDGDTCSFYIPYSKDKDKFFRICRKLLKKYVKETDKRDKENRYQQYLKLKKEFEGE